MSYRYTFYGNLTNADNITITQYAPDINAHYYKIKIMYWIITIDDWSDSSVVITTFLSNSS